MPEITKIQIRRGSDSERQGIVLAEGELGYTTDVNSKRVFVGDGTSTGGVPVASRLYVVAVLSSVFASTATLQYVQPNDFVFALNTSKLYALTGTNNMDIANYLQIT